MTMSPGVRRFVLTAHVATSVGWLGAVVAYIALDVTAVTSRDVQLVRSAYLMMGLVVSYSIVPLAIASVTIGILNALGTTWGLARHYWVLVKLVLTIFATTILLIETSVVSDMAAMAMSDADPRELPGSLLHSVGGLVVLIVVTFLSVYKPRGMTPYGWRKQQRARRAAPSQAAAVED
jgi:hypothetical protein